MSKEDSKKIKKMNCLQWAVFKSNIECVYMILVSGLFFDQNNELIDIKDEMNNNLIHLAASTNSFDLIELLMGYGVDANQKNKRGHTPFDLCTDKRCKDILSKYKDAIKDEISDKYFNYNKK